MRRPLAAQKGSARRQVAQEASDSGPAAPQNMHSQRGSSAAAFSAVLRSCSIGFKQNSTSASVDADMIGRLRPCVQQPDGALPADMECLCSTAQRSAHQAGCLAMASIFLAKAGDTWPA